METVDEILEYSPLILVVGGININLITSTDLIPEPGQTVTGNNLNITPGGKGANQAVGASRMGARVSLIGRIGDDQYGEQLLANLLAEGIDVRCVYKDSDAKSGIAIILLDKNGQNYIIQVRGANMLADTCEIKAAQECLPDVDALMIQNELPLKVTINVAKDANVLGIPVIFDPAPSDNNIKEIIPFADVIMPNQNEAEFLTGIKVVDEVSARKASAILLKLGVSTVVIKMGELGAYYESAGESGFVSSVPTDVVDSVAAGDAFGAAFTVSIAEKLSLREAVKKGCAAGSIAVSKSGAQISMPARSQVDSLIS